MIMMHMKDKRGSAFLYVTMAVFIVVLMSGIMVSMLTYEIRVNKITEKRIEAKYLAEAGVEHAMLGTGPTGSETVLDADGKTLYDYAYETSGGSINITSYGYVENKARIKIECNIREDRVIRWEETPMN